MAATLYVIIGDANTRKSSTARGLTGVGQKKAVQVDTTTGALQVFVQISALQESEIAAVDFISQMTVEGHANILVTLRDAPVNKKGTIYPSGSAYIRDFVSAGWHISQVVALGTHRLSHALPAGTPSPLYIPNSSSTPVNRITSQVRASWNWT